MKRVIRWSVARTWVTAVTIRDFCNDVIDWCDYIGDKMDGLV